MASAEGVPPAAAQELTDHNIPMSGRVEDLVKGVSGPVDRPELMFALVRTLGADAAVLIDELESALSASGYVTKLIKLSDHLRPETPPNSEADRYDALMDEGDRQRELHTWPEALPVMAFAKMRKFRESQTGSLAFIIDKLVRPEEVVILRNVYGKRLFVIGCDASRRDRITSLKLRFQRAGLGEDAADQAAVHAVNRDAGISNTSNRDAGVSNTSRPRRFCVSVAKTLEHCDVFVRADDAGHTRRVIRRLVECILSHPFHTLTLDELGMAVAFKAALTTASLSRQVGAAIMVDEQIVAVGANEVPKYGGGIYHAESPVDAREWIVGKDPSDPMRAQILSDMLRRLHAEGELSHPVDVPLSDVDIGKILNKPEILNSRVFDVIEYTRTAHAEMVAITGAARLGIRVAHGTLYTTTLPCHECTRNIIAAGIGRVVYLEPYPKSKGWELQSDSVALVAHQGAECNKVSFEPFAGISYQRFADLFSWVRRKEDDVRRDMPGKDAPVESRKELTFDGKRVTWKPHEAVIRSSIFVREFGRLDLAVQQIKEEMLLKSLDSIVSNQL